MKPKLLVVELWGLGDLVIATPFLRAASERYEVTLVAKPFARDLTNRFWPNVQVMPFVAPWTAFHQKYRLLRWPWREFLRLRKQCAEGFDVGLSGRWDPRDHVLLPWLKARRRLGFPRLNSSIFLTKAVTRPDPLAHRYENWRCMARSLGWDLPTREDLLAAQPRAGDEVLVHSGAGQAVRVWPLERYREVVARLRQRGYRVQVLCDPGQRKWWQEAGESGVETPGTIAELLKMVDRAGAFIGNDSGPAHLAACCGVPTLTLFGPQLTEWFAPVGPRAECIVGKPCKYKPCSDYCRFPAPYCLIDSGLEEVWARVVAFVERHLRREAAPFKPEVR